MKKTILILSTVGISCLLLTAPALLRDQLAFARENVGGQKGKNPPSLLAGCAAATAQTDLAVNNVRARLLTGGDMWWDLSDAAYEVPKDGGVHSIFAGSIWIGGIDQGKQLRVAGQTYRQTGNDFWPGPLDTTNASITKEECAAWDKFFRITRKEVETFVSTGTTTPAILNWPGNGDPAKKQAQYLAPFFDKDGDGTYNPSAGDYPGFDLVQGDGYGDCGAVNCIPVDQLFGDESIWWVINDIGNIHTETGGPNIGLEIRNQAFGFATDDDINNMTFYDYRIFNRSTYQLDSCYMGVWCDADLGNYTDDYVGCDVKRGLGYTYNSDDYDEPTATPPGYGNNPPAVGIDFFRGPIADANDGKDNDRDGIGTAGEGMVCQSPYMDESCEQIIMSGFLYYDNTSGCVPNGNPCGDVHFYNYLRMRWGDGVPVTYGGNGYQSGGPVCNFMYPGCPSDGTSIPPSNTTDEHDWGIGGNCSTSPTLAGWSEGCAGNLAQDRRMLLSAGPFTLLPGAVNVITTGVVWARANAGGALASVTLLQGVDDVAQALFDNCFKVLDGPTAPDITVQELNNELILYLSNNDPQSNNFNETYTEFDPTIIAPADSTGTFCTIDKYYHFEGYKIYQLKTSTVSANDLEDADKARLIYQCDIKNGVGRLINYEWDANLAAAVPEEEVNGADVGIVHSIRITTDAFATGASTLINHKSYYFMAVAYGYNEYKKYAQDIPPVLGTCTDVLGTPATDGQKKPYKQGRKNLKAYSAIPHAPAPEMGGTTAQSSYGSTIAITRIEGNGNGGMNLAFNSSTISNILSSSDSRAKTITYLPGYGPVNVKVIDPLNVPVASFTLKFDSVASITYTQRVGTFVAGDTIKGATSGATARVLDNNGSIMHIDSIVGSFSDGEYIQDFSNSGISVKSTLYNPGKKAFSTSSKHLIDYSTWMMVNNTTGDTIYSDKTIKNGNEHLIPQLGLSISFEQVADPGSNATTDNNGFIGAGMAFSDNSKNWLTGLADLDGCFNENWIKSGTVTDTDPCVLDYTVDNNQIYESVLGSTWAPYRLCAFSDNSLITPPVTGNIDPSKFHTGPSIQQAVNNAKLSDLASVDLVITSDKSKWTRAVVIDLCEDSMYASNSTGGLVTARARKFDFRRALSIDKYGSTATGSDNNDFATGMGWFPGYAINLETGERLNIAFGENSALTTRADEGVISYNRRDTIIFDYQKNGPFITGEQIIAYTSNATATIYAVSANMMIIESISGTISPDDIIVGQTSDAKAVVTSITGNTFQNGEMVMGGQSGATGEITVNNKNTSVMIINNISGTFIAGEQISGINSGAIAEVVDYSPYGFEQNGADMLWNPTANKSDAVPWNQAGTTNSVFGGQHYIYIFGHNKDSSANDKVTIPRYDKGKKLRQILDGTNGNGLPNNTDKMKAFSHAMWINIPLLVTGHSLLESDVLISLRVRKSYKPGYSPAWYKQGTSTIYSDVDSTTAQNSNLPMYTFSTSGIETLLSQTEVAKSALDMIRVVPNPYYAFSLYETSKLDSRVKITNLPETSTVSIYNLGGTLIRKYKKGEPGTNHTPKGADDTPSWHDGSVEWDLKNTAGIPISSGVYIIHVEVPGVGEKIVKWFGIMRPIDLDSF